MAREIVPPRGAGSSSDAAWRRGSGEVGDGEPAPQPVGREPLRVVGVAGSLRRGSYNRALLRAAQALCPAELRLEIHHLDDIPLFNEDAERSDTPPAVTHLREAVASADGLLVATPEYNHGVPGVMKNAFDWLSRPHGESVLDGKPTALMGATPGANGTARAQTQLRQSFVFTNTPVMMRPEVLVARVRDKIDADGRLTDPSTRATVATFLEHFVTWIEWTRAPREVHA